MTLRFHFVKMEGFFNRCIVVEFGPLDWRAMIASHAMDSLDYYATEDLLTAEERAARDRAMRFVQEKVLSWIVACHRPGKFPEHLTPGMGALCFYAPYLKEYTFRRARRVRFDSSFRVVSSSSGNDSVIVGV